MLNKPDFARFTSKKDSDQDIQSTQQQPALLQQNVFQTLLHHRLQKAKVESVLTDLIRAQFEACNVEASTQCADALYHHIGQISRLMNIQGQRALASRRMNRQNQLHQDHFQDILIKQTPAKNVLQIMGFRKVNQKLDCVPDNRCYIALVQKNFMVSKMIALAEDKVYRVGGLKEMAKICSPNSPKILYSNHISILKRETGQFVSIVKLPIIIEFKNEELIQYKLMGSANHTLVKSNKGFFIIGGSYRGNPGDQANFSRCVYYFNAIKSTLYLVSMLYQAKDLVLATILHQSIYIFGGRTRSSALTKGTDIISKAVQRIDISQILRQQQTNEQGSQFGLQVSQENMGQFLNQAWIYSKSSEMCQRSQVLYLHQNLIPYPSFGILSGVIPDNQSNSINIIGGRCNNQFLKIGRTIEFGDQPNSSVILNVKESQTLSEAVAILENPTSFQMGFKNITFLLGITSKLENIVVKVQKDRRQENKPFQNQIFFLKKLNPNVSRPINSVSGLHASSIASTQILNQNSSTAGSGN